MMNPTKRKENQMKKTTLYTKRKVNLINNKG